MKKQIKVLEVFAEVDDEDPVPKFGWRFFGQFDLHKIIGILEHIKEEQLLKLMKGTYVEGAE